MAQNVAFADAPLLCRQNVPDRDIPHVDPVQTRIQIGRHLPVQKIHEHLPGRSWFHVSRTHGSTGIDDDDRSPFGRQLAGENFRLPLGTFIVIAHLRLRDRRGFVGRNQRTLAARPGQANAADGAGIDNTRAAGCSGGLDHVARALHVGKVHRSIIAQPEVITGRNMETPIAPAHRLDQQRAVADIPLEALDLSAPQTARVAPSSHQHFNPVPATHQFLDEIPADKTRRASDKAIHDQTRADNSGFSRGNRSENFPPTRTP